MPLRLKGFLRGEDHTSSRPLAAHKSSRTIRSSRFGLACDIPDDPQRRHHESVEDPVVATALLDRLLHHAVVVQIEGSNYRLRQHTDLVPEHIRSKALIQPPPLMPPPRRRGRPPKHGAAHQTLG